MRSTIFLVTIIGSMFHCCKTLTPPWLPRVISQVERQQDCVCDIMIAGYHENGICSYILRSSYTMKYRKHEVWVGNPSPKVAPKSCCMLQFVCVSQTFIKKAVLPVKHRQNMFIVVVMENSPSSVIARSFNFQSDVLVISTKLNSSPSFYTINTKGDELIRLGGSVFVKRDNFQLQNLVWAGSSGFYLRRQSLATYKENRSSIYYVFSIASAMTQAVNGTAASKLVQGMSQRDPGSGRWTGTVGAICNGEADITFIQVTADVAHELVACSPLLRDGLAFITGLPQKLMPATPMEMVWDMFDAAGWILVVIAMVAITGVLVLDNFCVVRKDYREPVVRIAWQIPLQLMRPIITQPTSGSVRRLIRYHCSSKIAVGFWLLMAIYVSSDLQTKFVSVVTRPLYHVPPSTFQQLGNSEYEIIFVNMTDTPVVKDLKILAGHGNRLAQKILAQSQKAHGLKPPDKCFPATQRNVKTVCMGIYISGEYFSSMYLVDTNGRPLFRRSDIFISSYLSAAVSPRTPGIVDKINHVADTFVESGIMNHLVRLAEGMYKIAIGRKQAVQRRDNGTSYPAEKVDNDRLGGRNELRVAMLILLANGAALIIFCFEQLSGCHTGVNKMNTITKKKNGHRIRLTNYME